MSDVRPASGQQVDDRSFDRVIQAGSFYAKRAGTVYSEWQDASGGADAKLWRAAFAAGSMVLGAVDDAGTVAEGYVITRSAGAITKHEMKVGGTAVLTADSSGIAGTTITASTEFRGTVLTSNSTSAVDIKTSGGTQASFAHVAGAVNYWQISGGFGSSVNLSAVGSSSSISAIYNAKGSGSHIFTSAAGTFQFLIAATATAVEYLQVNGAASGGSPTLSAQGSSSNIPLTLANKGTAVTKLTGQTVQTTVGSAGGASALPATPTGYIVIGINGTDRVIPYYAAS